MKLFFCTNSDSMKSSFKDLLFKSIDSVLANSDFDVVLVYDGCACDLDLGDRRVLVIEHRHRLHEVLVNTSNKDKYKFNTIITGAFLRTDIPFLCDLHGFVDDFVLYCDFDIFCNKSDFSGLLDIKPEFLAAAPERVRDDFSYFNSGVMLMNRRALWVEDVIISDYIRDNIESCIAFDQTMYNALFGKRYTRLPVEYNWKPYWGINHDAKIIHFHGAKPRSVESVARYNLTEVADIRALNPEGYEFYNKLWEDLA